MIVTLAGHVDHGKTSLVRALTGEDTDRLAEEKRRGLTIDLGFAYLVADGLTLGFVDVPGHHKFIHNMVAGVAAMQHALLVIAADDGPMPQSREHLQILELLGISHGVIALTKCDRASAERQEEARREIRQLTANTFLADAPIIATSITNSTTAEAGIAELKTRLLQAAAEHATATSTTALFRMAIDRAFTVKGAGVVVTGTVHAGTLNVDEVLHLFPSGQAVRVKGVRVQSQESMTATLGDRCALNLAGVAIEALARGQWLAASRDPGSNQFSVQLKVLADFPRQIRHWLPVHVYHATSHTTGRLALLSDARIDAGGEALVELVTDLPLLVKRGDRIILRDQSLDRTLGGGAVVTTQALPGRRREPQRLRRIDADRVTDAAEAFVRHLRLGGVDLNAFTANWSLDEQAVRELVETNSCMVIDGFALEIEQWQQWSQDLVAEVTDRHRADPTLQGLKVSDLATSIPGDFLLLALNELAKTQKLVQRAGRYMPAAHEVNLSPAEAQMLSQIRSHLEQAQPPSLGDLSKLMHIPIPQLAKSLQQLVSKKQLVRISDNRYYLPTYVEQLARLAIELGEQAPFTVRQYRDAAEIGRNVAIDMLEYFDGRGFTRRTGDTRVVAGDFARIKA